MADPDGCLFEILMGLWCYHAMLPSSKVTFEINYMPFKFDRENLMLQVHLSNPHSSQRISNKAQVERG